MPTIADRCLLVSSPPEITAQAIVLCSPNDVAALSLSCRYLYNLIYSTSDNYIWRSLYLATFDDPRLLEATGTNSPYEFDFDWRRELQRRVKTENLLKSKEKITKIAQMDFALETLVTVLKNTPPVSPRHPLTSKSLRWFDDVMQHEGATRLLAHKSPTAASLITFTRVHQPISLKDEDMRPYHGGLRLRTAARAFVYDLRSYSKWSQWGPFMSDGTGKVNWTHLDKIFVVMQTNSEEHLCQAERTRLKFPALNLESTRPFSASGSDKRAKHDWAGVEGRWCRLISFMDYSELMDFNSGSMTQSHAESIFEDEEFFEAFRVMTVTMRITSVDSPESGPFPHRPTIRFTGVCMEETPNAFTLEGSVSMTKEGEICWTTVSKHGRRAQWQSRGIQIGGPGSAIGVLGTWSSFRHDIGDPVGPFWFWKTGPIPDA